MVLKFFPNKKGLVSIFGIVSWVFFLCVFTVLVIVPLWFLAVQKEIDQAQGLIYRSILVNYPNPRSIFNGVTATTYSLVKRESTVNLNFSRILATRVFYATFNREVNEAINEFSENIQVNSPDGQTVRVCLYSHTNPNNEPNACAPQELDDRLASLMSYEWNEPSTYPFFVFPIIVTLQYQPVLPEILREWLNFNWVSTKPYFVSIPTVPQDSQPVPVNVLSVMNYILPNIQFQHENLSGLFQQTFGSSPVTTCLSAYNLIKSNLLYNLLVAFRTFFNVSEINFIKFVTQPEGGLYVVTPVVLRDQLYSINTSISRGWARLLSVNGNIQFQFHVQNTPSDTNLQQMATTDNNFPGFNLTRCFGDLALSDRRKLIFFHNEKFEEFFGVPRKNPFVVQNNGDEMFSVEYLSFLGETYQFVDPDMFCSLNFSWYGNQAGTSSAFVKYDPINLTLSSSDTNVVPLDGVNLVISQNLDV
ncbi:MAG: hypothetical protein NZO16_06435, partial [Deltaproteobacteria bacterium]|nr:hypothetical protein [Deltaproteobacteria bacterium]